MPALPITSYPGETPSMAMDYMQEIRNLEAAMPVITAGDARTITYGNGGNGAATNGNGRPTFVDFAKTFVTQSPWLSLGIAAGVGFLLFQSFGSRGRGYRRIGGRWRRFTPPRYRQ